MEDFEIGKFRDSARRLLRENMRWIRAAVATSPLMDLLGAVVIVLVLMYARVQIKMGAMTAGIFVTFVYALFKSYEPVKGLGTVYQQFEQAFGATAKVFEYHRPCRRSLRGSRACARCLHFRESWNSIDVSFRIRSGTADPAGCFARGARRRSDRHCRIERRGQDHAGESAAAILSGHFGRAAHRRHGCARSHAALAARTDGHRDAGNHPV